MSSASNFDEVMGEIGFGRIHLLALFANGLCQMLTILETMGMAIIAPAAICDLKMNIKQQALITAAAFIGIICSAYFWGYFTDRLGRRWILLRTILISNLFSIISMFMINFSSFFIMRFLTGVFVAGPSFVAVTYLSEFCTKQNMARMVAFTFVFNGFAMLYSPTLATLSLASNTMSWKYKIHGDFTFRPWRLLGCSYILPGVLAFVLLLILPESPKFLFMVGKETKGLAAMDWICRRHTGTGLNAEQIEKMKQYKELTHRHSEQKRWGHNLLKTMLVDSMPLFQQPYSDLFMCSCIVMFSLGLVANGTGLWFTYMRNRQNQRQSFREGLTMCETTFDHCESLSFVEQGKPHDEMVCDDGFVAFHDSLLLAVAYILLHQLCALLLFVVSRKILFVSALLTSSTCGFILVVATNSRLQLTCFLLFLALPGVVVSLLGGAIIQFVPTYLLAKAYCICVMWARFGAVVGTIAVGNYLEMNCDVTIIIVAFFPLLSASIQSFLPL